MFSYQQNGRFFAQVARGLEDAGRREFEKMGATEIKPVFRGIHFSADRSGLYRINYCSRVCTRILAPLLTFDCHSDKYLYRTALDMPWENILSLDTTFAVFANVSNSRITHSQFAARRLKDAIVDRFRASWGKRPDVDPEQPDVWLNLHIHANKATVSLDTSGGSLHRRGYRKETVKAPMQETLAAAIVRFSRWDGSRPLYDPFCGSGTLLAEALMEKCRIPAGFLRQEFGFERMPDFDSSLWSKVKKDCDREINPLPEGLIGGSDLSLEAVRASRRNCGVLPGGKGIKIQKSGFQDLDGFRNGVIICNPPYGVRMEDEKRAGVLLKEFGIFLKEKCSGSTACIYLGKESLLDHIGLWPAWKKNLSNGGLQGVLARYKIR